ncbi:12262_t:CDS:2 [Ambispora leptoticha]|uniref:12262_t:CDS:1 n=1 Tax=Ambispora leptoticha TaxID=144679 RepID=A0A9N8VIM4_9GLOM|nr:12262_t:CDS:2 [Ambispora leptoticha]
MEKDYKYLIGKILRENADSDRYTKNIPKDMIVYETELPSKHRIIKPGYMYTCDFDQDRLQVRVNANNVIESVQYG